MYLQCAPTNAVAIPDGAVHGIFTIVKAAEDGEHRDIDEHKPRQRQQLILLLDGKRRHQQTSAKKYNLK
jgi:acyl-CoA hydrolase